MKTAVLLTFAIIFVGEAFGQVNLEECPKPKSSKTIPLHNIRGTWFVIRLGPPCDQGDGQMGPPDCLVETMYADKDYPDTLLNMIIRSKFSNGTIDETLGTINSSVVYEGYPENTWQHTLYGESAPLTFIDSDDGKSWVLGYSCWEMAPKNNTAMWFISSRVPYMDPKLEQTLVNRVVSYSPTIKREELIGIGHTDCY